MAMAIKNHKKKSQQISAARIDLVPVEQRGQPVKLGRFDSTITSDLAIFCCQQKGGSIFFIVQ